MQRRLLLAALAAAASAAGCSAFRPGAPALVRRTAGRFSAAVGSGESVQTATGKYRLERAGERLTLELLTPLNGVIARIETGPGGATFQKHGEEPVSAESPERLLEELTGIALPAAMLESWLDGVPSRKAPSWPAGDNAFEQSGWRVDVRRRDDLGRPALLRLARPATPRTRQILMTLSAEHEP
ncbi:MAG: hypothetical protein HUK26_00080 [Duodenibacillus sp.]|nr:hypothetical protein [Duodenibacillus sp.]